MPSSTYVILLTCLASVHGHGRLVEPPSRASAWRYGFNTPPNYNDHELYCGGFTRQWVTNGGKCGVCGDAWDAKSPRAHEYGGTYGQGVIVRRYGSGGAITARVELTANHNGYFEFAVCPDFKTTTQACLDKNVLTLVRPQEGLEHRGVRYFPREGNKVYEIKYRLPKMTCEHCLFQWRYVAGNNWGNCPNGTGAVGCGPQEEFRSCADISIGAKGGEPEEPTGTEPTEPEETYSPITAILISVLSFLVVFLILALLYIHFYQVGKSVKGWLKAKPVGPVTVEDAPMPPPRAKKNKMGGEDIGDLFEVNLKGGSLA